MPNDHQRFSNNNRGRFYQERGSHQTPPNIRPGLLPDPGTSHACPFNSDSFGNDFRPLNSNIGLPFNPICTEPPFPSVNHLQATSHIYNPAHIGRFPHSANNTYNQQEFQQHFGHHLTNSSENLPAIQATNPDSQYFYNSNNIQEFPLGRIPGHLGKEICHSTSATAFENGTEQTSFHERAKEQASFITEKTVASSATPSAVVDLDTLLPATSEAHNNKNFSSVTVPPPSVASDSDSCSSSDSSSSSSSSSSRSHSPSPAQLPPPPSMPNLSSNGIIPSSTNSTPSSDQYISHALEANPTTVAITSQGVTCNSPLPTAPPSFPPMPGLPSFLPSSLPPVDYGSNRPPVPNFLLTASGSIRLPNRPNIPNFLPTTVSSPHPPSLLAGQPPNSLTQNSGYNSPNYISTSSTISTFTPVTSTTRAALTSSSGGFQDGFESTDFSAVSSPSDIKSAMVIEKTPDSEITSVGDEKTPKVPARAYGAPLLGKIEAKKRLLAFSGKTSFSLNKVNKSVSKNALGEADETGPGKNTDPKKLPTKKKKKEEKMSVIEQIRSEESRIKQVLGPHCSHMFNPYTPQFASFLDNPESLLKLEEKGRNYVTLLEKRRQDELKKEIKKEEKRLKEKKEREQDKIKRKEKEKERLKHREEEKEKRHEEELERELEKATQNANKMQSSERENVVEWEKEKREGKHSHEEENQTESMMTLQEERHNDQKKNYNERSDKEKKFDRERSGRDKSKRDSSSSSCRTVGSSTKPHRSSRTIESWKDAKASQSWSGSREKKRRSHNELALMKVLVATSSDGASVKGYPGRLVQLTRTRPQLSYSVNPDRYEYLYHTRNFVANTVSTEALDVIDRIWNAKSLRCPDECLEDTRTSQPWFDWEWSILPSAELAEENLRRLQSKWDSDSEISHAKADREPSDKSMNIDHKTENTHSEHSVRSYDEAMDLNYSKHLDSISRLMEMKESDNSMEEVEEGTGVLNDEYEAFLQMVGGSDPDSGEQVEKVTSEKRDRSRDRSSESRSVGEDECKGEQSAEQQNDGGMNEEVLKKTAKAKKKTKKKLAKKEKRLARKASKKAKKEKKKAKKEAKKAKKEKERVEADREREEGESRNLDVEEGELHDFPLSKGATRQDKQVDSTYGSAYSSENEILHCGVVGNEYDDSRIYDFSEDSLCDLASTSNSDGRVSAEGDPTESYTPPPTYSPSSAYSPVFSGGSGSDSSPYSPSASPAATPPYSRTPPLLPELPFSVPLLPSLPPITPSDPPLSISQHMAVPGPPLHPSLPTSQHMMEPCPPLPMSSAVPPQTPSVPEPLSQAWLLVDQTSPKHNIPYNDHFPPASFCPDDASQQPTMPLTNTLQGYFSGSSVPFQIPKSEISMTPDSVSVKIQTKSRSVERPNADVKHVPPKKERKSRFSPLPLPSETSSFTTLSSLPCSSVNILPVLEDIPLPSIETQHTGSMNEEQSVSNQGDINDEVSMSIDSNSSSSYDALQREMSDGNALPAKDEKKEVRAIAFKLGSTKSSVKIRKSALQGFGQEEEENIASRAKLLLADFHALHGKKNDATISSYNAKTEEATPAAEAPSEGVDLYENVSPKKVAQLYKDEHLLVSTSKKSVTPSIENTVSIDTVGDERVTKLKNGNKKREHLSETESQSIALRSPLNKRSRSSEGKSDVSVGKSRELSPSTKMKDQTLGQKRDHSLERKRPRSPEHKKTGTSFSTDVQEDSLTRKREKTPDRIRDKSPENKRGEVAEVKKDQSQDGKGRSPVRKTDASPEKKKDKSPDRKRDRPERSPDGRRAKSPERKRTPDRRRERSLERRRERSQERRRERSPERRRERTPERRRERSPDRRRDRTPDRRRERTPERRRERSPDRRRERSLERRRERSLDRRRERSPDRQRDRTPDRGRPRSPERRRDRTPDRRDRSPIRGGENSAYRYRETSHSSRETSRSRDSSHSLRDGRDSALGIASTYTDSLPAETGNDYPFLSHHDSRFSQEQDESSSPKKIPSIMQLHYHGNAKDDFDEDEHRPEWKYDSAEVDEPILREWQVQNNIGTNNVLIDTSSNLCNLPAEAPPVPEYPVKIAADSTISDSELSADTSASNIDIPSNGSTTLSLPDSIASQAIVTTTAASSAGISSHLSLSTSSGETTGKSSSEITPFPSNVERDDGKQDVPPKVSQKQRASSSPSPPDSPQRLSLDDRLAREHGLVLHDEPEPAPVSVLQPAKVNWKLPTFAAKGGAAASNVIQVGNMLQILPQEAPPTTPPKSANIASSPSGLQSPAASDLLRSSVSPLATALTPPDGGVSAAAAAAAVAAAAVASATGVSADDPNLLPLIAVAAAGAAAGGGTKETVAQILSLLQQQQQSVSAAGPSISPGGPDEMDASFSSLNPDEDSSSASGSPPSSSTVDQELQKLKELQQLARKARKERKERRRKEREERRAARKMAEVLTTKQKQPHQITSDDEDEAIIREAISEEPNLGSPVAEYELEAEAAEASEVAFREAEEERLKRLQKYMPAPPPDRGILMSPNYRIHGGCAVKSVKFADGVLPGEGTSPSGGEEIHSPPPPAQDTEEGGEGPSPTVREKRLRKKNKPRTRPIKLFEGVSENDVLSASPPPPPGSPPPGSTPLFLYPGNTHYTLTQPGTAVLYTHPTPETLVCGDVVVPLGAVAPNGLPPASAYDTSGVYDHVGGMTPTINSSPFTAAGLSPFAVAGGSPFVITSNGQQHQFGGLSNGSPYAGVSPFDGGNSTPVDGSGSSPFAVNGALASASGYATSSVDYSSL